MPFFRLMGSNREIRVTVRVEQGILMEPYTKKITTGLAVKVIIKGALLAVCKVHPC